MLYSNEMVPYNFYVSVLKESVLYTMGDEYLNYRKEVFLILKALDLSNIFLFVF